MKTKPCTFWLKVPGHTHKDFYTVVCMPDGALEVRVNPKLRISGHGTTGVPIIVGPLRNGDDLVELLLLRDALYGMFPMARDFRLQLTYCSFLRSDRRVALGYSVGASIVNDLLPNYFSPIAVYFPHSMAPSITEYLPWYKLGLEYNQILFVKNTILVGPDINAIPSHLKRGGNLCAFKKERDPETGYLKHTGKIEGVMPVKGKKCIIVDDIFDGGAGFISTIELLHNNGIDYEDISIRVPHFIGSNAENVDFLHANGIKVMTTNSYDLNLRDLPDNIEVVDLFR